MSKPIIKTEEELLRALIDEVLIVDAEDKSRVFMEMVSDRYERNENIYHSRMTDFTGSEKIGLNDNVFNTLNEFRRLDDMAETVMFDAAKAAMMMGMCDAGSEHYSDCSSKQLYPTLVESIPFLEEKYEIPADIKRSFKRKSDEVAHSFAVLNKDISELPLEQYPFSERINAVCCGLRVFYDSNAFVQENGKPVPITPAFRQIFAEASAKGAALLKAAMGEGDYKPQNEQEKRQIETLTQMTEGFTDRQKQDALAQLDTYANPEVLINEPLMVEPIRINLKLEKNYILKDMTVESFTEKAKLGSFTRPEKEWGEATIDRMMSQMYTINELKELKAAGIDPATEIYVDGNSALDLATGRMVELDGHETPETFRMRFAEAQPRLEDYAEFKCAITAAALEGRVLDVNKLRANENGEIHRSQSTVSVNTKNDMKREPVSLWHRFLRFIGLEKAPEDKTLEGNNPERHDRTYEALREKIDLNELMGTAPRRTTTAAGHQTNREISAQK